MKVLVCGSEGFLGRNVSHELTGGHEVYRGVRSGRNDDGRVFIDLADKISVRSVLSSIRPEIIINCAGIVDASADVTQNLLFTKNILESVVAESLQVKKIILSGSAGEYGLVDPSDLPVAEDAPLVATSPYGVSKIQEIEFAKKFAQQHSMRVIEARIFNPIGPGMHDRFLITRILQHIKDVKSGVRDAVEINRMDAARDYIDVRDVARALAALVEEPTHYTEYNIGSGKETTNKELIDLVFKHAGVDGEIQVRELSSSPEAGVASAANISRIVSDIGWRPKIVLDQTIQDIVEENSDDTKQD